MKCQFRKSNGEVCKSNHINESDFCFRHDPNNKEAKFLASRKGGQNRALQGVYGEEIVINSPTDIKKFLGSVINGVWTGKVPVPVGTSMGFLAKCWLEAHSISELQTRLVAIERKVDKIHS
ncbi:MAG: hypothetical protein Q7T54_03425 [Candidatus Levybacteria bacterium]|nr:hypothetical protein [Candidatus Levybacteria bacterium]